MKKYISWLLLFIIVYTFIEGSSLTTLFLLEKIRGTDYYPANSLSNTHRRLLQKFLKGKSRYMTYSFTLGWTIKKNGKTDLKQANSQGIRSHREYQLIPPDDVIRIASFGDSFTHCEHVKNNETWQERLNGANPNLEVINFGVGGYGLDQALLRYEQDGVKYASHIIFLGFMSENIYRNVSVFRPFYSQYTGIPLAKPRFTVVDDKFVLLKNPLSTPLQYHELLAHPEVILPKIGANDLFYQTRYRYRRGFFDFLPSVRLIKMVTTKILRANRINIIHSGYYNERSEAFQVTCKIFEEFQNKAISNNSLPIIVIFPHEQDVMRYFNHKTKVYTPLLSYLDSQGYQYIDLMNAFYQYAKKPELNNLFSNYHYSSLGNELVAKYMLEFLQNNGLVNPDTVKQKLNQLSQKSNNSARHLL